MTIEWLRRLFCVLIMGKFQKTGYYLLCIAFIYKKKGDRREYTCHRGIIRLASGGKVYGRMKGWWSALRVTWIKNNVASEKLSCVNQNFM